jgi:hypothetical protein
MVEDCLFATGSNSARSDETKDWPARRRNVCAGPDGTRLAGGGAQGIAA